MLPGKIPGGLRVEDLGRLLDVVGGKCVLMLGCYCGRGLVAVAGRARRVWVLDDFKYPGGMDGVVEELKANVNRHVPDDRPIDFLYGTAESWAVPVGSSDFPDGGVEVVYRDADRPARHKEKDEFLAYGILRSGGVYAWHGDDGGLKWLTVEPVSVEVN